MKPPKYPPSDLSFRRDPPLVMGGQGRRADEIVTSGSIVLWCIVLVVVGVALALCWWSVL